MPSTAQLSLPLVMPAQAQKHVTVNEALSILDAVTQLRVLGSDIVAPPAAVADGDAFVIPSGAEGEWQDKEGFVAVGSNGGWSFLTPRAGWRAWDQALSGWLVYDGARWVRNALAVSAGGATLIGRIIEFDHTIKTGATNQTSVAIPSGTQVIGVSGRVLEALNGAGLTGWRVGVADSDNRYGSGIGIGANSSLAGLSGSPVSYYAETPLLITGEGGSLASGKVRLAIHLIEIAPPSAI